MDNIIAFIPVRGGSKSIPLKNIKLINGRPLVYWTIDAAVNCRKINTVYVSTDSREIKDVVDDYPSDKVKVVARSAGTATDYASTESAMLEFAADYNFGSIVLIQATSPLLTGEDLELAIGKYTKEGVDSLLSVVEQKRFIWEEDGDLARAVNYDPLSRPRRQEFSGFLVENGAFYITKRDRLMASKCRISGRIATYKMDEKSYFEIDEPSDWLIVEKLLEDRNIQDDLVAKVRKIKMFITDCDGVLTDGGMYYSEKGDELKKFNTKDGMGINILHQNGIKTAIITGEDIEIVSNRAKKLKIEEVHLGIKDKVAIFNGILKKYGLKAEEVAYIGDDINDIDVLKKVGLSFSVADGMESVRNIVDYVTKAEGGKGAVREAAEMILRNKK